ncbi:MAG: nitrate reductase molybdenum cofactor assembly chaperone [Pseudomonadota bacterium]
MNLLLKALGALISYPDADLRAALPEIAEAVGGARALPRPLKEDLAALIGEMAAADAYDLEENYVGLFDRGRATSLHLFEHVHGESRDRGQAMVDLRSVYARHGLTLAANELPDYLPAMLEYLALVPEPEARDMLGECAHILRRIGEALAARGSRHSAVFAALLAVAGEKGLDPAAGTQALAAEKPLDEEWAEEPVIFGPQAAWGSGAAGCGAQPQVAPVNFVPRVSQ